MAHVEPSTRVSVATLDKYIPQLAEPLYHKHVLPAMIRERGREVMNSHGTSLKWQVDMKRVGGQWTAPNVKTDFVQVNRMREATLPWRMADKGESVTKMERLMQGNGTDKKVVLQNVVNILKRSVADFTDWFAEQLFVDGTASATNRAIYGLPSIFNGTATANGSSLTANWATADSYAGLLKKLGSYGGSWTGTYPAGTGDYQYHAWTPLYVDTSNSNWGEDTNTWQYVWQDLLSYMNTYQTVLQKRSFDLFLLEPSLLLAAKKSLQPNQRFEITQNSEISKLGFRVLNYEGVDLMTGYGPPSGTLYALDFDALELHSMQNQMFVTAEDQTIDASTKEYKVDYYGQLKCEAPSFLGCAASETLA